MNYMKDELNRFIRIAEKLLQDEEQHPVVKPTEYSELGKFLDLEISKQGVSDEKLEEILTELVLRTPKTQSKSFFNQLFGGRQPKAYLGELLSVLLNTSMYTYKVGGPMIAIEKQIIHGLADLIGFDKPVMGTMATGGSMTNFMSLLMARDVYDPQARVNGMTKPLVAYTSEEAHYSIYKNAAFAGIGKKNVRIIPSDAQGRMNTEVLEKEIIKDQSQGLMPFYINATAGTTVLGSFDDIPKLVTIRDKYKVWLHVDAAYGGSVIFSTKHNHFMEGAHLADSVSINAHKMLGTPLTCSFILTHHPKALYDSFSNEADYLYQDGSDEINPGKISLQCGRRNDALKFWTLWKAIGTEGIGNMVDKEFELSEFAKSYIINHPDYEVYGNPDDLNICFNYKNVSAIELCTMLNQEGELMVGYGKFKGQTFVRLVTVNTNNSSDDILEFFRKLEAAGNRLNAR